MKWFWQRENPTQTAGKHPHTEPPKVFGRTFNTEDFIAIIGKDRGEFEDLLPVKAARISHRCGVLLASGGDIPHDLSTAFNWVVRKHPPERTAEFESQARVLMSDQPAKALEAIENAIICDNTRLSLWKTAGDLAVKAGNPSKGMKYYQLVAKLSQVRGGDETLTKHDLALVVESREKVAQEEAKKKAEQAK